MPFGPVIAGFILKYSNNKSKNMNKPFSKIWIIVIALIIISGGILVWQCGWAQWETYSNPEVNFSFRYPLDWEIKYVRKYKSAACQISPECEGIIQLFLNKKTDNRLSKMCGKEKFGIAINMPQCSGVRYSGLPGNNWICVFGEDTETLDVYEKIKNSFQLFTTDNWKVYRNQEYGFEVKYPPYFYVEEFQYSRKYAYMMYVSLTDEKCKAKGVHNPAVYIYVIKTNLTAVQWLEEYGTPITMFVESGPLLRQDYRYYGVTGVKQIKLNNTPALQFAYFGSSGGNQSTLFKKEPDMLYEIDMHSSGFGSVPEEVSNPMLSSFRFIGVGKLKTK